MERKIIKGIKSKKFASKECIEAITKLKQASMNSKIIKHNIAKE